MPPNITSANNNMLVKAIYEYRAAITGATIAIDQAQTAGSLCIPMNPYT
jgi:hypothetical protein